MSEGHIGDRMQMPPESIERLPDAPEPADRDHPDERES